MIELTVIKILLIVLILTAASCSKDTISKDISLYNGFYSAVNYNDGYAFLCNIQEYYNKPSLVSMDNNGNIRSIYLINSYRENITSYPFYKLLNNQGRLVLVYKKKLNHVVIEDIVTKSNIEITNLKNRSYGSLIQLQNQSIYIKSGYNYGSSKFKGYTYSCYSFDKNLNLISEELIDIGIYQPQGLAYIKKNLFYYKGNNILYQMNVDKKKEIPLYKFPNEIVESKTYNNKYYVLLESSLFIFNSRGEVKKGFKFNSDDNLYKAVSFNICKDSIVVTLDNSKNEKIKVFSNNGNQINEIKTGSTAFIGEKFINMSKTGSSLLYTKDSYLHLKEF